MNFSKINQSRISQLEKEALSKVKGGDDPDENDDDSLDSCIPGCYRLIGNRVVASYAGLVQTV